MERRAFVRSAVAGALGAAALPGALAAAAEGAAMTAKSSGRIAKLGVQLYTVRGLMHESVEKTLVDVAAAGYREVEFAGYFQRTPKQVRAALKAAGLEAPSTHVGIEQVRNELPRLLDDAKVMGHRYIVVPWLDQRDRTPDGYRALADDLNRAGEAADRVGIRIGYHNHDFEFTLLNGERPFDLLLQRTAKDLVSFELDLFWITKAGGDPLAYFRGHPGRFALVHVKDMTAAPEQAMVDVGAGSIDWKAIFARRGEAGIRHFFVEHDGPADALASIRASAAYLRALRF